MIIDILIDLDRVAGAGKSEDTRSAGMFRNGLYGIYMQVKGSRECGGPMFRAQKAGKGRRTEPSPEVFHGYIIYIIGRSLFPHKEPLPGRSVWMPDIFRNPATMQGKTGDRLRGKIEWNPFI